MVEIETEEEAFEMFMDNIDKVDKVESFVWINEIIPITNRKRKSL